MKISRSALLPYSAAQMYAIVADIRAYPEFLQWCEQVNVISEKNNAVEAKMQIAYGKLAFAFTTLNENRLNESIQLTLVDGPFSEFAGVWEFTPLTAPAEQKESNGLAKQDGCKISLDMEFKFRGKFASGLLSKMFEKIAIAQLDAFLQRATVIYQPNAAY